MTTSVNLQKAELRELDSKGEDTRRNGATVQFNPETLKVGFANQIVPPSGAGDQRGTSAIQYVGSGTTKLSVQLWFDVNGVLPQGQTAVQDVRELTKQIAYFITPIPTKDNPPKFIPPGVRFLWGSFQFDGIMDSLEESLEFFSPEGRPQRASVTLSLSQQKIQFTINPGNAGKTAAPTGIGLPSGAAPGTQPLTQARAGDTLQGLANDLGKGSNWQAIAAANGIENPRLLAPGQVIDLNVSTAQGQPAALNITPPQLTLVAPQLSVQT